MAPDNTRRDRQPRKGGSGRDSRGAGKGGAARSSSGRGGSASSGRKGAGGDGKYGRDRGGSDRGGSDRGGYRGKPTDRDDKPKARRDLKGAAVDLPHWVIEDVSRVTPKERVADALEELGTASNAMMEGRYKVALRAARKAKDLAPRDATVRETLGLAAYRTGDWQTAIAELRAYRRIAGEPTHMPIEMDVLRALGRKDDVVKVWQQLQKAGAAPAVHKEGLVVYASFLIDEDNVSEARRITTPKQVKPNPYPADLRVWYVAARANALVGDGRTARQLRDAIVLADPAFPGLDDLDAVIGRAGT